MPADSHARQGRLEVICGCMFSGKTRRLIEELEVAQCGGQAVRAFKHRLDRRYGLDCLATHDGKRFAASAVTDAAQALTGSVGSEVVGIDEAQFFGRALAHACQMMRARGQRVIVAGIDHDAWGRPFPPLPQLKEMADQVEILHAPCRVCGAPARFSQRMVPVTDPDMVGGPGEYEPRCARCFQPLPPPAPNY